MEKTMSATASPLSWSRITRFALIAVISNLVIYGIGSLAGAGWEAGGLTIAWYLVLGATLVPIFIAAGATSLLGLVWKSAAKVMAWIGLIFALVTVPSVFITAPELGTAIALGSMHIIVGLAWFFGIRPRV